MSMLEMKISLVFIAGFCFPNVFLEALRSLMVTLLGWIRYPGFFISSWITTVIAVERCVSVVLPFKVKEMFSPKRSLAAIISISGFYIGLVYQIFEWVAVEYTFVSPNTLNETNSDSTGVVFSSYGSTQEKKILIVVACAMVLSILCQIVLILCTVLMIYALKSSSKVRRQDSADGGKMIKGSALSVKERKLFQVAMCLALVNTGCNIPRYVTVILFYALFILDMETYAGTSFSLWVSSDILQSIYSSCNFFVYLSLNSQYRKRINKLCSCQTIAR
ncbi:neuromedin-U receptor 2 [Biomphalaria glabrata]|nr:neuromedin-U receptor 2 [Biomphalaria glabrata]